MLELLRKDFQLAMVVFLSSCAIIAIAPFSVLRYRAGEYGIAASFGCAELTPDDDLDSWLNQADQALYQAKADGRNCVRAFGTDRQVIT